MIALKMKSEHEIFRESLRKFLAKEATPNFQQWEAEQSIPKSFWKKLGEQGFLCPWADEEYGGVNADFLYSIIVHEELESIGTGMVGIGLHNDIAAPYIYDFGTEEQKRRWIPGCVSGEYITAIAMTEPGAGSDLANIRTTAIKDGDEYVINGEKTFITNGYSADLVIVACKTNLKAEPGYKGISLFVIEAGTPGFTKGKKLDKVGQHSNDTCELIFEDVRVSADQLLGEENHGFYYLMKNLQQERLVVAISAIKSAEIMLEITMNYTKKRTAFGNPISAFQNTQFKLAEIATEISIGRNFVDNLVMKHMNKEDIVTEVSMAKWWISDLAKRISVECMQLHGGYGYMEEYEIARRFRDTAVTSIYAGTNEVMKHIIAKKMGL
ncbi:acyl-CoA dehydrogenase family protein [Lysinibacillus sp. LZ02]|uniref:acyl-CoA dehydrogenase family protein n=1 Tax=Lysinibacillus sp. LZ02 TaxID=3420668 RepID=UPI003D3674D0